MSRCDELRIQFASSGFDLTHFSKRFKDHLNHCQGCSSFINTIPFFDQAIKDLPVFDAPKKLIDNTIAKIIEYESQQKQSIEDHNNNRINRLALIFTVIATAGFVYQIKPYIGDAGINNTLLTKSKNKIIRFPTLPFQTTNIYFEENSNEHLKIHYNNRDFYDLFIESSVFNPPKEPTIVANGYWSNSYQIDNSDLLQLSKQMQYWNVYQIYRSLGFENKLEFYSKPVRQSFEKPIHSALAVYLQSDRSIDSEPTRMRLQIGIQARDFPIVGPNSKDVLARNLLLKIRLAPEVKLYGIIGSYPLNNTGLNISEAYPTMQSAKNQRDLRTSNANLKSKTLSDDAGIHIKIPKFLASDTHVILLDVLVNRPGHIAEVALHYKDQLFHRNAANHANLNLDQKTQMPEQLRYNVTKNLLAQEISQTMQLSSDLLQYGNKQSALDKIVSLKNKLVELRKMSDRWHNDKDIAKDEKMLANYIAAFKTLQTDNKQQQQYLHHSLKLAASRKLGHDTRSFAGE